ncbi:lrr receptor-like serine/threonine-protein kinase fls2 [Quercus suber]|uniref:Lrr receptor-like serine/threonine-protein kinase fls2 n=1 Tax=Quercus suber TaxID=58331 RepID=A0AAW0KD27_QUESU
MAVMAVGELAGGGRIDCGLWRWANRLVVGESSVMANLCSDLGGGNQSNFVVDLLVIVYKLLLVLLLLSLLPLTETASPATQAEALIEWKNSLLPSSFLSSWSSTNITNLCKWNGMVCGSTGTVSQIIISGANLNGTLAQFNFTPFLNVLSGPIPSEIGQLTELQYVSFYNSLNGTIPYQFSNLQNVWYLDLGSNYIATPDW